MLIRLTLAAGALVAATGITAAQTPTPPSADTPSQTMPAPGAAAPGTTSPDASRPAPGGHVPMARSQESNQDGGPEADRTDRGDVSADDGDRDGRHWRDGRHHGWRDRAGRHGPRGRFAGMGRGPHMGGGASFHVILGPGRMVVVDCGRDGIKACVDASGPLLDAIGGDDASDDEGYDGQDFLQPSSGSPASDEQN
ncbi:hypothetical protein [Mangrovibrevibacter kandeliae]|nr:hypothetical protein [Aurantimonas sp. CSK15Z-1]MCQ8784150.1 hypothetical protein [Aurantimonas sp. CSK15Z-1]